MAEYVEDAYGLRSERTWHLDETTRRTWSAARDRWDALAAQTDTPPAVAGAAAKAAGQSLRVALVLAELVDPGHGRPIPAETMAGAAAIVDYTLSVWAVLGGTAETLATSRREDVLGWACDQLARWIQARRGRVTRRDILRAQPFGIRKASQLDDVLAEYKQVWPGTVRDEKPLGGGPVATVVYAPRDDHAYTSHLPASGVVGAADNAQTHTKTKHDQSASSQADDLYQDPLTEHNGHNVVCTFPADNAAGNVAPTTLRSSSARPMTPGPPAPTPQPTPTSTKIATGRRAVHRR